MADKKKEYFLQGEDIAVKMDKLPPMPPTALLIDVITMQSKLLAGLLAGLISLEDRDVFEQVRTLLKFTDNICGLADAYGEELDEESSAIFNMFEKIIAMQTTKEQKAILDSEIESSAAELSEAMERIDDKLKGGLS